nr:helix-turn-helix transcriptional regulator [Nocardioides flavescens]
MTGIDPAELGARIKRARLAAGLTQSQLGGEDASTGYVSRIESGQRRPDLALLTVLAARLGVEVRSLLSVGLVDGPDPDARWDDVRVALDHAELSLRGGSPEEAGRLLDGVEDRLAAAPAELVERAAHLRALLAEAAGDLDGAIEALEDLLELGRDRPGAAAYAIALSRCYRESGDFTRAATVGEACLDALRSRGLDGTDDALQLAVTVAGAHILLGDLAHAARLCRRIIARAEEVGSRIALASAYWNASVVESQRGAPEAAAPLARRALHLWADAEGSRNLARLRSELGMIQLDLDPPELDDARANLAAAARELDASSASPVDKSRNALASARADLLSGEPERARAAALPIEEAMRSTAPVLAASAAVLAGQAAWELGERDEAVARYRAAIALLTGVGSDRRAAELWFELGARFDEAGLRDDAHAAYRSAAAATGLRSAYDVGRRSQV